MNAHLQPITVRPIAMPEFNNEHIKSFAQWFAANDKAITAYYNLLRPVCEDEPLVDYWAFSALMHEREELKLMSERLPHGEDVL